MPPLLIAGPILRRTEPVLVTVWVALSAPATVEVRIWDGLVHDATSAPLLDGVACTCASGEYRLHRAHRQSTPCHGSVSSRAPCAFAQSYVFLPTSSYATSPEPSTISRAFSCTDGQINGHPHLGLGYEPGFLPTFQLPPMELTDLRILHGSCRRITQTMHDGMAWVDDLIEEARRNDQLHRPHRTLPDRR